MAEIIRRGELPENIWYEHTCGNCSTYFKFKKGEMTPRNRHQAASIECPLCHKPCYMSNPKRYQKPSNDPREGGFGYWDR